MNIHETAEYKEFYRKLTELFSIAEKMGPPIELPSKSLEEQMEFYNNADKLLEFMKDGTFDFINSWIARIVNDIENEKLISDPQDKINDINDITTKTINELNEQGFNITQNFTINNNYPESPSITRKDFILSIIFPIFLFLVGYASSNPDITLKINELLEKIIQIVQN